MRTTAASRKLHRDRSDHFIAPGHLLVARKRREDKNTALASFQLVPHVWCKAQDALCVVARKAIRARQLNALCCAVPGRSTQDRIKVVLEDGKYDIGQHATVGYILIVLSDAPIWYRPRTSRIEW